MSALTNELRTHLLGSASIAALVGTRVYPDVLPQSAAVPAIVYGVVSTVVHEDLTGPSGLEQARIQLDSFAATRLVADQLARLVQSRCEGLRGWYGAAFIAGVIVPGGQRHDRFAPVDGSDEWRFLTSVDLLIAYRT